MLLEYYAPSRLKNEMFEDLAEDLTIVFLRIFC